ncbi:MAG: PD-(D/E)XK nuclease family protein [Finegoldia sp.]|nr:PD-(D/E)XK nuclease family protein [Finegoldia sp.]
MNYILTSSDDYIFKDNLSYIKNRIEDGDTDFCLILPNRKIIKEVRHELTLANGGLSIDLKIWTLDDLVNARDISDYLNDLILNLAIEALIGRGDFEDNQFFKSESFVDTAKSYISSFKYSKKSAPDILSISTDNQAIIILAKLYIEYERLMAENKIMDKFDYYKGENLDLRNIKDVYIHGFSELRCIEYDILEELSKRDVNIYICVDNYSSYKENFIDYFQKRGFIRLDFKDDPKEVDEVKAVKCSNFDVEVNRLIYELYTDSKTTAYRDMAILIEDESKKESLIEGLKSSGICLRQDDTISSFQYKIFKDLVNMLDTDLDYKDYMLRLIGSDIIENAYEDKKAIRLILKDLDFNSINFLRAFFLSRNEDDKNDIYLSILEKADAIHERVFKNDIEIINFIMEVLEDKSYDDAFLTLKDELIEFLDTLYKNYRDILCKFSKLNRYLINLIRNFEVDDSSKYIDGIKIFNLANIKLNAYKILYVLDASDDNYPKNMRMDFFTNDETLSILKANGVDLLDRKESRVRAMDRLDDACKSCQKLYFSYNTKKETNVRSRYINRFDIEDESYSLKDYLLGINKDLESAKNQANTFEKIEKAMEIEEISPTAIETYFSCPMKYFFKYLLYIRKEERAYRLDLGNVLHKSLQDFYSLDKDLIDKALKTDGEIDLIAMDKILENNFIEYGLNLDLNENSYNYSLYKDKLKDFIKKDLTRLREDFPGYYPTSFEEAIAYDFHGYKIKGRIDRVDFNPETSKRVLIDYKTTKSGFVKNQNFLIENQEDKKTYEGYQLALYYFYGDVYKCLYMSINDGEIYDFTQGVSLKDMEEILLKDIEEYVDGVKSGDFFKKARNKTSCRYCDYRDVCLVRDIND